MRPLSVYAAKNPDERIRRESSSGGIFTALAERIIAEGGVVFGAQFNEQWEVVHGYTETAEGLSAFRGSKYVQSIIGNTFRQANAFLEQGRKVLFSGTPCQIAGLRAFLRKDWDTLFTVDLVCFGVPSPAVWRRYLEESIHDTSTISSIRFRAKVSGWKRKYFCIEASDIQNKKKTLISSELYQTEFGKGFGHTLYHRPSCHHCPVRFLRSGSDITIADYWSIQNVLPKFDDDKGTSLVMVNTAKGRAFYDQVHTDSIETSYEDAVAGNPMIEKPAPVNPKRSIFFRDWNTKAVSVLINELTHVAFHRRVKNRIRALIAPILRKMGLLGFVKSIIRRK
jgi:coenzyme F420-reducing hydrogenase beta subunit